MRGFEIVKDRKSKWEVTLPSRADSGSAGYDLFSPGWLTIRPEEMKVVWLDIKAYMPQGEVLMLYPRSSMGKVGVTLANSTGVIDSSYYDNEDNEGNIGLMLVNNGSEDFRIKPGQAIGQGVFMKYLTVDSDTPRNGERIGGFGSSDRLGCKECRYYMSGARWNRCDLLDVENFTEMERCPQAER